MVGRTWVRMVWCVSLLAVCALGAAGTAAANIITVNTTDDELNSDGDCSLREAIRAANMDVAVDNCTAGNGTDDIILSAGTYTLTVIGDGEDQAATGDLDIRSSLKIHGAGAATTIIQWDPTLSNADRDRIFDIFNDSGNVVEIRDVTLRNGVALDSGTGEEGGAIFNEATTTLERVVITNNKSEMDGGGIMNNAFDAAGAGVLTIIDSTISNNAAGAFGPLTDGGGGIYNRSGGQVTLINSTVSGNSAAVLGGGIFNDGGASQNTSTTFTMVNVTLSGNTSGASGAGLVNDRSGTVNMNNVTIAFNTAQGGQPGGGVRRVSGTVNFKNTIIADNNDASAPDCSGSLTSQGYNLIGDPSGCTIGGDTTGNRTDVDPLLGPLANNGGPTQTHALLFGSPAIDTANPVLPGSDPNACARNDQRNATRPQGSRCDIGAFEFLFRAAPALNVGVLMAIAGVLAVYGTFAARRRSA
jgi:CSLREA domain-containing protein